MYTRFPATRRWQDDTKTTDESWHAGCGNMCTNQYSGISDMSTTMTIRLDDAVKDRLDRLADATHRSKSFLAADAILEYINLNEWQIQEIQAALKEADAGDFATDEQVKTLADKWNVHAD